ncbi:thioredoxin domain-containing protein [Christiangramia fulva]|uniref:Thioredoxin domain-containing protein n=1 Tax=Christiangramia fulva TaxID=2126553 RepID=A0A2R3Z4X7_9FLAO|nr:thioredoxin domain-containing protein [Christiangramia fulva]AVR45336.1 thioredoxin domain-containing protein [Christiangramia fulva]
MSENHAYTNDLITESSPYLLQHAHNPVNWKAWKDEILEKAKKENKLLLISIGYSSCHWCHVMEKESFEDQEVADIMNSNYICIKVDREERPDVDQVYMNAVQIMTGSGGWPMNVVALPDGRPVWGGTYFQKKQWMAALQQIAALYKKEPQQLNDYASRLEKGLKQLDLIETPGSQMKFHREYFIPIIEKWQRKLDTTYGGRKGAPKFMMPSNLHFLLRYSHHTSNDFLKNYCLLSLEKMAWGGLFDHVDGGFSRYSVDEKWHIPHFEKMLYDNAQLISLYSEAYKLTGEKLFREVIEKSLNFISREMTGENAAFYSSFDADSKNEHGEAEEGAFYAWQKEELQKLLGDDFEIFSEYFNINSFGKWEGNKYVLIRSQSDAEAAKKAEISEDKFSEKKEKWLKTLFAEREKRSKPGLDDKIITSWNAMMSSGFLAASQALGDPKYLKIAQRNIDFILRELQKPDGRLFHSYRISKSSINGYLEDYAFVIKALLDLYETCFDEKYLSHASEFLKIVQKDFSVQNTELFRFNSAADRPLVSNPIETNDNVIPASNSVMAKNIFRMGKILGKPELIEKAQKMLHSLQERIPDYPDSYSNWLDLMLSITYPFYEVAITGPRAFSKASFFHKKYLPHIILAATEKESEISIFTGRFKKEEDLIYVCENGSCKLPVKSESAAIAQLEEV